MHTDIRIEVPQEVYDALRLEQEKRRQATGRKTAMATIILENCCNWMNQKDSIQQTAVVPAISGQAPGSNTVQKFVPTTTELLLLEKKLMEKDTTISRREVYVNERTCEYDDKFLDLGERERDALKLKEEALDLMEKARQKSIDSVRDKWVADKLTQDLATKDSIINMQKSEINSLRNMVQKSLDHIEKNTKSNVFMDYIMPVLPSLIAIIGFVYTNKKISNMEELSPIQNEIKNIYKKLSPEDSKMFTEILKNTIDNNVKEVEAGTKESMDKAPPAGKRQLRIRI